MHDTEIKDSENLNHSQLEPRSKEPLSWLLFGFGGMAIAFALPSMIICMLVAGFSDGHKAFHLLETISHWWGAGALFLIILGASFHSMHRIYHSLHDFKIHTNIIHKVILYGLALCMTLASAVFLGLYYFGIML